MSTTLVINFANDNYNYDDMIKDPAWKPLETYTRVVFWGGITLIWPDAGPSSATKNGIDQYLTQNPGIEDDWAWS